jgi:hypothetical protein
MTNSPGTRRAVIAPMERTFIMNDRPGAGRDTRGRPRFWLDVLSALLIIGVAFAAAACGSSPSSSGSSSGLPTLRTMTAEGLAYAKCMRSHGIQNYPDPTVQDSGQFEGLKSNVSAAVKNLPGFKAAAKTCEAQTHFGVISPAMMQAGMAKAVKFTECMRSHGISNFPDPIENSNGIQFGSGTNSGIDRNSAQFKAAQSACTPLLGQ